MSECVKIWYFQQKKWKIFCGGATPRPFPSGEGETPSPCPHPLGACGTSTPPILKSWVRHCLAYHIHNLIPYGPRSRRRRRRKGRKRGEGCPLTFRLLGVWGSVVLKLPGGVRGGAPAEMDFIHIWGHRDDIWNTLISIFERWLGPQASRGPGKLSPFPSLSTGLRFRSDSKRVRAALSS